MIIIGIGNAFRRDDAAGLLVARAVRERSRRRVAVLERDGEPTSLIEAWETAGAVIVIDAVSSGSLPGTLHVIDAGDAPLDRDLFRHSTHSFGVAEAVELAKALGKFPRAAWIVGVEGKDFGAGTEISPEVLEGVEKAADTVLQKIDQLIGDR